MFEYLLFKFCARMVMHINFLNQWTKKYSLLAKYKTV